LESIIEFTVSVDGNVIPGATLNDGAYSVTYSPSALSVGNHTLTIYAKDNFGKTASKSISFTIEADEISVSITKPSNGSTIGDSVEIRASVFNIVASQVRFLISKVGSTYATTLTDNNGNNGWSVVWNVGGGKGSYNILAQAIVGSQTYSSPPISVIY